MADIKPAQRVQLSASKGIGVKKHATLPVGAISKSRTFITQQLLSRSGQDEHGSQSSQKFRWATSQLGLHFLSATGANEALQRFEVDDFWKFRIFGDLTIKTLE